MGKVCSVPGCLRLSSARGWCGKHYDRWKAHGDPLAYKIKSGKEHHSWKDGSARYANIHQWLSRHYSHLKTSCEDCGSEDKALDFANISGKYIRNISDYKVLCRSCHRKFDYGKSDMCRRGMHKMDNANTYICTRGWKNCRECRKIATVKFKQKGSNGK